MSVWSVAVTVSAVQAVAVLSNIGIGLLLIYSKQYRVGSNVLLLHLTTCNVFLSALTLACLLPVHLKNGSVDYNGTCSMYGIASHGLHGAVVWTVCALNYDKHSAICLPLSYNEAVVRRRAIHWILTLWSVVTVLCIGGPLATGTSFRLHSGLCLPSTATAASRVYTGVYTIILLIVPTTTTGVFNIRILSVARKQHSRIISAIISTATINARLTVPRPELDECRLRSHRSATTATLHALAPLLLVYTPLQLLLLYGTATGEKNGYSTNNDSNFSSGIGVNGDTSYIENKQNNNTGNSISLTKETAEASLPPSVFLAVLVLVSLSPLQALVYVFQNHGLRKVLANVMRRQLYKSAVQLEIDARARAEHQRRNGRQSSLSAQLAAQMPKKLQRRLPNIHITTAVNTSPAITNILSTTTDSARRGRCSSHMITAKSKTRLDNSSGRIQTVMPEVDGIKHLDPTTTAYSTAKGPRSSDTCGLIDRAQATSPIKNEVSAQLNIASVITESTYTYGGVRCTSSKLNRSVKLNGTSKENDSKPIRSHGSCWIQLNSTATPKRERFANIGRFS